ncbi:MAG: hypothetical protein P1S60_01230 [Anaerolineae bacterium]|nr:hypothetical protein [Anaerolineae bacterium]
MKKENQHKPTDLRAYRQRTERNLVIAVVIAFLIVGSVMIGSVYGWASLFAGLLIMLPGVAVFVLLLLLLKWLERLSRDKDD